MHVVEKLPSFVKLVSSFSKPISISVEVFCFFDLIHLPLEICLVACLW